MIEFIYWMSLLLSSVYSQEMSSSLSAVNECPIGWIKCANENNYCYVLPEMRYVTIAYGRLARWTFVDFSHTDGSLLTVECNDRTFGETNTISTEICCLNPYGHDNSGYNNTYASIIGGANYDIDTFTFDDLMDENNWVEVCNYGTGYCYIDYNTRKQYTGPYIVRYGAFGTYTYRLVYNRFYCFYDFFGHLPDIDAKGRNNIECDVFTIELNEIENDWEWIYCGSQTADSVCDLNVDGSVAASIPHLIKYGVNVAGSQNWYYRKVWSSDHNVRCHVDLFDGPYLNVAKYCYLLSLNNYQFEQLEFGWQLVGSCTNCDLSVNLNYGVSSENEFQRTTDWESRLKKIFTAKASFSIFGFFEIGGSTHTTSEDNKRIIEYFREASKVSVSRECQATCPSYQSKIIESNQIIFSNDENSQTINDNNKTERWFLYQWITQGQEFVQMDWKPFSIYSCNFICIKGTDVPQCPLGFCENDECTKCTH